MGWLWGNSGSSAEQKDVDKEAAKKAEEDEFWFWAAMSAAKDEDDGIVD